MYDDFLFTSDLNGHNDTHNGKPIADFSPMVIKNIEAMER